MEALLVLTNLPDRASAEKLADGLIGARVAACVNILAPCRSVYRWKDAVQHDEEHPVLIKTTRERYAALESAIRAAHPYELPEIIGVPVVAGLAGYLGWIGDETREAGPAIEPPAAGSAPRSA
jgi:periplasmic divalent cation tolerance protein